jgi:hypothetical protein
MPDLAAPDLAPQMPGLEVWFQRASDVVRKLMYGDVDIGIVGYDMLAEIGDGDAGLLVLHDALAFGRCASPCAAYTGCLFPCAAMTRSPLEGAPLVLPMHHSACA